jgi:hypothetical protein
VHSENQLIRKLGAQIPQKRRANLGSNESPRAETAITPTVCLHPQREKAVDEQILEPILPSQTPPNLTQPIPTNPRETIRAQLAMAMHCQRGKVVDEQILEPILPNRDPPNRNKSYTTDRGETVKPKAFPKETTSPQL